jgi:peptide deformylase
MEIIKIHYKVSKPVKHYREIEVEAEFMRRFIVRGAFKGLYNKAFAIAHCQVSETPMSFFVVDPNVVKEKMFEDDIIINPEIIVADIHKKLVDANGHMTVISNTKEYQEPCMSFPYRHPKRIVRFDVIQVRYQIKGILGLKTIERELEGIASEIFQHEYDHTQGKNIYFESEVPVKWWELIGKDKSKGGVSLDNQDVPDMSASREKAVETVDNLT